LIRSIEKGVVFPPLKVLLAYEQTALNASASFPIVSSRLLSLVKRLMPTDVIESQPQTLSEDIVQKLSRHNAINLIIQESESDGSDKKGKENSQEEYLFSANELIMRKRKPRASDKKKLEV